MTKQEEFAERLAKVLKDLGIDPTGWSVETWAPGDGWRRYRVYKDNGSREVSSYLNKDGMDAWLHGMAAASNEQWYAQREKDAKAGN